MKCSTVHGRRERQELLCRAAGAGGGCAARNKHHLLWQATQMNTAQRAAPLTAFVLEDSLPIRERLAQTIRDIAGAEIIGEAGPVGDAINGIGPTHPGAVILDLQLEDGSGLEVLRAVHPAAPMGAKHDQTEHEALQQPELEQYMLRVAAKPVTTLENAAVILDRAGRILSCGVPAEKLFGANRAQLAGRWISELISCFLREGSSPGYGAKYLVELCADDKWRRVEAKDAGGRELEVELRLSQMNASNEDRLGAFGIRERIRLLGGEIEIRVGRGRRRELCARIPLTGLTKPPKCMGAAASA